VRLPERPDAVFNRLTRNQREPESPEVTATLGALCFNPMISFAA